MDIQETVVLNPKNVPDTTTMAYLEQVEYFDMPVPRANAVAFILLQRIYSNDEEVIQDERGDLVSFINRFVHQKTFSGSADDFHNFAVELAQKDEYSMACDILEVGMKTGSFGKNCDLLADYLQYGISCGRIKEAKAYFKTLMSIPRRKWTWRSFSFGVNFLQYLDQQGGVDKSIQQVLSSIDFVPSDIPDLSLEEKCMLALVKDFKKYHPGKEEPFLVEGQIYISLKEEDKALHVFKEAEDNIANCPKCALRRADILFERGDYPEASKSVQRALEDSIQTQSSVNEGYLHYLLALCQVANVRKNKSKLTDEVIESIYFHFDEALEEFGDSRQNYRDIIKRNAKSIQTESKVEIGDDFINLSALVNG